MTTEICETGVPHTFEPDVHFCCKMRYKRQKGNGLGVTYVQGREAFHNSDSIKKQENDHVAEMKAAGVPFERA